MAKGTYSKQQKKQKKLKKREERKKQERLNLERSKKFHQDLYQLEKEIELIEKNLDEKKEAIKLNMMVGLKEKINGLVSKGEKSNNPEVKSKMQYYKTLNKQLDQVSDLSWMANYELSEVSGTLIEKENKVRKILEESRFLFTDPQELSTEKTDIITEEELNTFKEKLYNIILSNPEDVIKNNHLNISYALLKVSSLNPDYLKMIKENQY